ncbi:hypothetical protein PFLmoz3_04117 [Pseudomonas fluorescens]|uniref:Uncharacterized protein n=1 Tax=Pseudomonas fluorescens TaxID=294 RepID=A0A109LF19_PSEFL|nr:hypothetical protein PFLmoz3_04117 [Pseudomonas fluorescens]
MCPVKDFSLLERRNLFIRNEEFEIAAEKVSQDENFVPGRLNFACLDRAKAL